MSSASVRICVDRDGPEIAMRIDRDRLGDPERRVLVDLLDWRAIAPHVGEPAVFIAPRIGPDEPHAFEHKVINVLDRLRRLRLVTTRDGRKTVPRWRRFSLTPRGLAAASVLALAKETTG